MSHQCRHSSCLLPSNFARYQKPEQALPLSSDSPSKSLLPKKKNMYKHAHLKIFKNCGQMRTLVYMRVCKAIVENDRACVRRFVITDVRGSN